MLPLSDELFLANSLLGTGAMHDSKQSASHTSLTLFIFVLEKTISSCKQGTKRRISSSQVECLRVEHVCFGGAERACFEHENGVSM
jgi:hypothetical protein